MKMVQRMMSALRGASWLVRAAGLRESLQRKDARIAELTAHLHALTCRITELNAHLRSRTTVFGHTMFLDPADGVVSPILLNDGCFEPLETQIVSAAIRPGDVVLDVGANIGYYTLLFARLVGESGRVIAFEPDPGNFRLLEKNVRANGYRNVVLKRQAVSDVTGKLRLYLSGPNKGDHRLYDSADGRESITVEATTLDHAVGGDRVDFIKMDIQGSEPAALRGMAGVLRANPHVRLITEFWPIGLKRFGADAAGYLDELLRLGFGLWEIDEPAGRLARVTPRELLDRYPADHREDFTNLFCARVGADGRADVPQMS
jgi:FkbM family methyltransferase